MSIRPIHLGVNVDHVATLREARGTIYPDVVYAAQIAAQAGARGITAHLREDRRHIQDRDIRRLRESLEVRLNLEMAVTEEMLSIAEEVRPAACCLVPERRQELTTEGGLDVVGQFDRIKQAVERLAAADIEVSLFIAPDPLQIEAACRTLAPVVELHTGHYAELPQGPARVAERLRIEAAMREATLRGLIVNAGHGLHYHNVEEIARLPDIHELNIGHAIVARALFTGLEAAVRDMRVLMDAARLRGSNSED